LASWRLGERNGTRETSRKVARDLARRKDVGKNPGRDALGTASPRRGGVAFCKTTHSNVAGLIGIPMYVCATASVAIAAVLVSMGISSGAALAFLAAGPAANAATVTTVSKVLGKRAALTYLGTAALSAVGTVNLKFPRAKWAILLVRRQLPLNSVSLYWVQPQEL